MKKTIIVTVFIVLTVFSVHRLQAEEDIPFSYNDNGQRDPFWPLVNSNGTILSFNTELTINDLRIEGILGGQKEMLAIINGGIVKEGDFIGDFKVQHIDSREVIFLKNNKEYKVRLKAED